MIKRLRDKWVILVIASVVLAVIIIAFIINAAGVRDEGYSATLGKAKGSIQKNENGFEFELENIFARRNSKIDYLTGIEIPKGTELKIDSSGVNAAKEGKYTVVYTITDGIREESESIIVNIRDEESRTTTKIELESESAVKSEQVIDGDRKYPVKSIEPAKIELMSGKVATVECTTARYIVSTKTDTYNISRNGSEYQVTELVVVFNTGEEQVLETVQKKID